MTEMLMLKEHYKFRKPHMLTSVSHLEGKEFWISINLETDAFKSSSNIKINHATSRLCRKWLYINETKTW